MDKKKHIKIPILIAIFIVLLLGIFYKLFLTKDSAQEKQVPQSIVKVEEPKRAISLASLLPFLQTASALPSQQLKEKTIEQPSAPKQVVFSGISTKSIDIFTSDDLSSLEKNMGSGHSFDERVWSITTPSSYIYYAWPTSFESTSGICNAVEYSASKAIGTTNCFFAHLGPITDFRVKTVMYSDGTKTEEYKVYQSANRYTNSNISLTVL